MLGNSIIFEIFFLFERNPNNNNKKKSQDAKTNWSIPRRIYFDIQMRKISLKIFTQCQFCKDSFDDYLKYSIESNKIGTVK